MSDRYTAGDYLEKNPSWHEEDSAWKARHILAILRKNGIQSETICEVGCGAGEVLNQVSLGLDDKAACTGYDISPQAYEIARKKERPNLSYVLGDLFEAAPRQYDLMLAIDVVEHIEDYLGFLRRLKPYGKRIVFHIPLDLSAQTVLRSGWLCSCRESVGHLQYFTKETALATLVDAGYRIVDYRYTASCVELPVKGWKASLMRLPRKVLFALNPEMTVKMVGGFSLLVLCE